MNNQSDFLVEARAISKAYPGVLAVDRVSLDLRRGEIHGIVGENGAGKTTLMKILAGLARPDRGEIRVNGAPVSFRVPSDAIRAGIGMVQQHFALVPTMTVAENIALGETRIHTYVALGLLPLNFRKLEQRVRDLSSTYHFNIPPAARVEDLSVGLEQRVELLRTLYLSDQVLILDEPTAVLTPREVRELTHTLRTLTERGTGIFFISHHLQEVLDFTDRVSVMRDGRLVKTVPSADASKADLARMMIGSVKAPSVDEGERKRWSDERWPTLAVRDLWVRGPKEAYAIQDVSFEVHAGEILGIAGIDGNGQVELAAAIAGLRPVEKGEVLIKNEDVTNWPVKQRQRKGLAYIPPDRLSNAVALRLDVADNLILRTFDREPFSRRGWLRLKAIRSHAESQIAAFDIRVGDSRQTLATLSGGNQQKVVLARELQDQPAVLVSCYATRGLDIAAVASLQQALRKASARGAAVLCISNEIDELLHVSDRLAVMSAGKVVGIVDPTKTDDEEIGLLMGQK